MPQEPGTLDRIFNSTIAWPQQMLWRMGRIIADDEVDLFSEKGLFDAALIPILGVFDDHKEDVMPDQLFGEGFGGQLAGSIFTDPLTYLTGGLAAAPKIARAAQAANKAMSVAPVRTALAEAADAGQKLSVGDYHKLLDELPLDHLSHKELKAVTQAQTRVGAMLPEIGERGLKEFGEEAAQRQIALGLPGLTRFGAKISVAPGYESWWRFMGDKTAEGRVALTKVLPVGAVISKIPFANAVQDIILGSASQFARGYKVGKLHHFEATLPTGGKAAGIDQAAARMEHSAFMSKLLEAGGKEDLINNFNEIRTSYPDMPVAEAFAQAAMKYMPGQRKDAYEAWHQLTGNSLNAVDDVLPFAHPQFEKQAAEILDQYSDLGIKDYERAQNIISDPNFNSLPEMTLAGEGEEAAKAARDAMAEAAAGRLGNQPELIKKISTAAFTHGKKFRALVEKGFRSGTESSAYAKAIRELRKLEASSADKVKEMGEVIYHASRVAAREKGMDEDTFLRVMTMTLEADVHPDEIVNQLRFAGDSTENAARVVGAIDNVLARQRQQLIAVEQLMKSQGLDTGRLSEIAAYAQRHLFDAEGTRVQHFLDEAGGIGAGKPIYPEEMFTGPHSGTTAYPIQTGRYKGRFLGSLTDDELARHHDWITAEKHRKRLNKNDLHHMIRSNDALRKFGEAHGLSDAEVLAAVVGKGGKPADIYRARLWKDRKRWSYAQADASLDDFGLTIVNDGKGVYSIRASGTADMLPESARAALFVGPERGVTRQIAELTGKRYTTIAEAMRDARGALEESTDWIARNGLIPAPAAVIPARITKTQIKELQAAVGGKGSSLWATLNGGARKFDQGYLHQTNPAMHQDFIQWRSMNGLRGRKAGMDIGVFEPIRDAMPPRPIVRTQMEEQVGDLLVTHHQKDIEPWALRWTRARFHTDELKRVVDHHRTANSMDRLYISPSLLEDVLSSTEAVSATIRNAVIDQLGPTGKKIYDELRLMQGQVLRNTVRSGVYVPGAPLAYLGRFFNKEGSARISKVMGDMASDEDLRRVLSTSGVAIPANYARITDSMTVEQLNGVFHELDALSKSKSAHPKIVKYRDHLEEILQSELLVESKFKHTAEKYADDAVLSLMQRMAQSDQSLDQVKFFDDVLRVSEKPGQSMMVGGKVIRVYDDKGRAIPMKARPEIETAVEGGVAEQRVVETVPGEMRATGVVIETDAGEHINVNFDGLGEQMTGLGLLPLGLSQDAVDTTSKAIVRRLGMDNMERSMLTTSGQIAAKADELVGQHVVWGAQGPVLSSLKAANQLYEVAGPALRTYDSINYGLKAWQTVYRLPFHIANISSGVFQANLAGAGPRNVAAGYFDAMRVLFGDQKWAKLYDRRQLTAGVDRVRRDGVRKFIPVTEVVRLARRLGHDGWEKIPVEEIKRLGLDNVDDLMIPNGAGGQIPLAEVLAVANKELLFGTFSNNGLRSSRTVAEQILDIKIGALEDGFFKQHKIKRGVRSALAKMGTTPQALRESSELLNRLGATFAFLREGMPLERAVKMAKEAHVPYEQITKFERDWVKRAIMYYTFPAKYAKTAFKRFGENPSQLSEIANTIKQDGVFTTQEGKAHLKVGDYRIDFGRMNANAEMSLLFASFFDKLALPVSSALPGTNIYGSHELEGALTDAGLLSTGGVSSVVMPALRSVLPARKERQTGNWFEEATDIIWPTKYAFQMAGYLPDMNEKNPYVQYTEMEKWISRTDFGLGVKKVRPQHEVHIAKMRYHQMLGKLKLRYAAATDPEDREMISENVTELSQHLVNMMQAETK